MATLGPSSTTPEIWQDMLLAGVTAFRLNTSHLELENILGWLENLSDFRLNRDVQIPVVLDMQGSKWRIGQIENQTFEQDQQVELVFGTASQLSTQIPVPHRDFFLAATQSSGRIILNDARVILAREQAGPDWLKARVIQGGILSARRGITYADSGYRNEDLTEKDRGILAVTQGIPQIQYAVSYVRDHEEIVRYREIFGEQSLLVAKIERRTALDDAPGISKIADALWLCRGDLGAELGLGKMARATSHFTRELANLQVPVLMAGQVLEHMSRFPQATRSEICYLLNCLETGYKGFVLSDETAIGQYPVESCAVAAAFKQEESS